MATTVKIYGERHTAVELAANMLRHNFDVTLLPGMAGELDPKLGAKMQTMMGGRLLERKDTVTVREAFIDRMFLSDKDRTLGWIHGAPLMPVIERRDDALHLVVVVRHIYSWLVAMHKKPLNALTSVAPEMETFLRSPWVSVRRENVAPAFTSPIDLWAQKMRSYVALHQLAEQKGFGFTVIRYEDLIRDQLATVTRLGDVFTRTAEEFSPEVTDGYTVGDGKTLSDEARSYINKRIDPNILARFHYALAE